jgi:hypothetical protein
MTAMSSLLDGPLVSGGGLFLSGFVDLVHTIADMFMRNEWKSFSQTVRNGAKLLRQFSV